MQFYSMQFYSTICSSTVCIFTVLCALLQFTVCTVINSGWNVPYEGEERSKSVVKVSVVTAWLRDHRSQLSVAVSTWCRKKLVEALYLPIHSREKAEGAGIVSNCCDYLKLTELPSSEWATLELPERSTITWESCTYLWERIVHREPKWEARLRRCHSAPKRLSGK